MSNHLFTLNFNNNYYFYNFQATNATEIKAPLKLYIIVDKSLQRSEDNNAKINLIKP